MNVFINMNQGYQLMNMWRDQLGAERATVDAMILALEKLEERALVEKIREIHALN